ncbi:GEVED domain-containing protein, partial [Flavobacterium sp.]|uniref:GEVED domain-containing protein n=1 Tax=Flavobacterium sp. TaxID=239 RepID=UPI00261F3020
MMNNYNSLSYRKLSKLSSQEPDVVGNSPNSTGKMRTSWLMSLCFVFVSLFMVSNSALAQTNIANYTFSSTTGATYTPITGGTVLFSGLYDNNVSTAITMGGTFPFGGSNFTTCFISANGYITFGAAPAGTNYTPLSTLGSTTGAISAFGQDAGGSEVSGAAPEISYLNTGTEFVVQYKDHANYFNRSTERLNFQIRLTYATGVVNIVYGTQVGPGSVSTSGTTPQVGIRGNTVAFATNVNLLQIGNVPAATTCNWSNAVAGNANSSTMLYSGTTNASVNIPTGLRYTWTPGTQLPVRTFAATTGITTSAATVSWTAPTGATTYNVQYRVPGSCTWTNWSGNPVATPSVTLTGLTANTSYQVRVQAINGAVQSDYSHIPNTAGGGNGYTSTGTFTTLPPACSGTPTAGTVAPLTRAVCTAVVPGSFTVSGFTTGVTGITFQWLESSSPTGPFGPVTGTGTGAATATYTPPPFLGTTIYYVCRVACTGSGLFADTAPVSVTQPVAPTTQASAATTSNASSFGMTASWTNGNGARRVVYINNSPTFTDPVNGNAAALVANTVYAGSGQQIVLDGTAATVSVTGLSLGTTYYFKVYEYARCGSGPYDYYYNTTTGTNTASGTTCPALSIPFTQNFESAVVPAIPTCTSIQNAGSGNNWATINNPGTGFTNKTLKYTYNSLNAANAWFYTSAMNLTAGTSYTISYKYGNDSTFYVEKLKVAYGTSPVATAMTNAIADHPTINTATPTTNSVIFTPPTSGVYFFGFNAYSIANQNGLFVDDISITLTPTCYVPTGLSASNLTPTTTDVTWTAPTSGTTPLQYEYAVTTSATPPTSGTVSVSNSVTGVTITPLTTYYLHVRSECVAGSDYSSWATSAPFQYIPGDTCSSAINLATLTSPYNGTTVGATNDFTNTCASGNTSPDLVYYIDVPAGYTLVIGQTANGYDSENTLNYGGACPGTTQIACYDDPDVQNSTWTNTTGVTQRAYWVQDGFSDSTNFGTFTLAWALTPPPIVVTSYAPAFACTNELASTVITLTGSNFTGATDVKLNGVSQSFTVVNDTTITVALSATSTSGTFVVYNAVTSGTNATALPINVSPTVSPIVGVTEICLSSPTTTLTNATGGTIAWSSSNPSVATIDAATGAVTALTAGSTVISYSVTSAQGCVTTVTHNIDVRSQVVIGTQPSPQVIVTGNNATFTVAATGTGLTYQWEESTDNGATFNPLSNAGVYSGVTTSTLTLTAVTDTMNTYEYRCVITGTSPCAPETSSSALLTVGNTGIGLNPSNVSLCDSGNAVFTVAGTGTVTGYQWYEYDGTNVTTLTNTGDYSGADTAVLTVSNADNTRNGYVYYADIIGPANTVTTTSATLNIATGVTVSAPSNQTNCASGGSSVFTVTPSGSFTTVQWQYSSDNISFNNVVNGTPAGATYTNASTNALTVATTSATPAAGTYYYRALVGANAPCVAVASSSAQLLINNPVIDTAPVATSVFGGNTATFTATSSAPGVTYQWQRSATLAGTYVNVVDGTPATVTYSGATTGTLSVTTSPSTPASTNNYYRVVITSNGCSTTSSGALLTVTNYCVSNATNTADDDIAQVTFGSLVNPTTAPTPLLSNAAANKTYTDFTALPAQNFTQLSTYPIVVKQFNGAATYYQCWTKVFIDWNKDGDFADAGETYNGTGGVDGPATAPANGVVYSSNITVPLTASLGLTRMRIILDEFGTATTTANGCGTFSYGETEDYLINVLPAPTCEGTPVAGTATSSVANVCFSGTANLSASGFTTGVTNVSMQWHNSAGPIAGANSATYTTPVLTATETYFLRVTCDNSGLFADTNILTIGVSSPSVDSTLAGERCGTGSVVLNATGSAGTVLNWYTAATGGSLVGTGSPFNTPVISTTTPYYVSAEILGSATTLNLGAGASTSSSPGSSPYYHGYGGQKSQFIIRASDLTAAGFSSGKLNSVAFEITSLGTTTLNGFNLKVGTTAQTAAVSNTAITGLTTVYSNAAQTLTSGVNTYNFSSPFNWDGSSNLVIEVSYSNNNTGGSSSTVKTDTVAYTSTLGIYADNATATAVLAATSSTGLGTLSSNTTTTVRPRMIFGFTPACQTPRVLVTATVNTPPVLTLSSSSAAICSGSSSSTVTVTSTVGDYDSYTWSPSLGVSGDATSGYTFNPTATTAYTLTATNAAGCANTTTFNVTVNPIPTPIIISPSATQICANAVLPVLVSASVGAASSATGGCLVDEYGQYPSAAYSPTTCNGSTVNTIATNCYAGEYTLVNVNASTKYTFTSNGLNDYVTITDGAGTVVLAAGASPVVWTSSNVAGQVRFWTHSGSSCGVNSTNRTRSIICEPLNVTYTWSPISGLFNDAAGTSAYSGDARANVYAKPTATTVYTVTAAFATGCSSTSSTTVTVLTPTTYYADIDGDGYGNEAVVLMSCTPVAGYVTVAGDCNDNVASTNPGAVDVCYDGIDNDCNGIIDNVGLPGGCTPIVSTLPAAQCGTTVSGLSTSMYATNISGAQGYRFKVTNMSTMAVQIFDRPVNNLAFSAIPGVTYNTQYQVEIGVRFNNVWQPFY